MKSLLGTIKIKNTIKYGVLNFKSSSDFFNSKVYLEHDVDNGILKFIKPTEMFDGKTIKTTRLKNYFKFDMYVDVSVADGEYNFEEESNEDEVLIYYKN